MLRRANSALSALVALSVVIPFSDRWSVDAFRQHALLAQRRAHHQHQENSPPSSSSFLRMASIEHTTTSHNSHNGRSSNGSHGSSSSSSSSSTNTANRAISSVGGTTNDMPLLTRFVAECALPNQYGNFRLRGYRRGEDEPTAVVYGDLSSGSDILVRVHDQCFTSEVMGSTRCDCKEQLDEAFKTVVKEGSGVIIYLPQEGRGIGLANKIAAYALQDGGLDTVEANHELGFDDEMRTYDCVPDILEDLGVTSIKLLTNNPFKVKTLRSVGVNIAERRPLVVAATDSNRNYMRTKALRMAHILPPESIDGSEAPGAAVAVATAAAASDAPAASAAASDAPAAAAAATSATAASSSSTGPSAPEDEGIPEVFSNPHEDGKEYRWELGPESVVKAIEAVKNGEMVVVTDDASRENEGDIIMAAELATTESLAFTVRYTGGVICAAMPDARMQELQLPPMLANNEDPKETAFTVTVDCNVDTTTGISAEDRAQTFRMLANPKSTASMFTRPGHVFPLRARDGGVLVRDGHTEATVDLCRMAGLQECGLLSEIVTKDSKGMARMPELEEFCEEHKLVLTTITDMICYRLWKGI